MGLLSKDILYSMYNRWDYSLEMFYFGFVSDYTFIITYVFGKVKTKIKKSKNILNAIFG